MKKIKLFLAAMAAMVSLGINAQSWTAPTIQGEDPVAGTQYKVMNVGSAKYLDMGKAWFGWSTTAIVSDNGTNFTMTADGSNWKFIRTGTQGVFTSGNGIAGDAMHVDNTANTYGITKLPNGYYHIHDAGGNESSTCWGYNSSFHATGVVAHADATASGWNCEWVFIQPANIEAVNVYKARLALYNEYLKAVNEGANTDDAAVVYNNSSATVSEINAAITALHLVRYQHALAVASNDDPRDITEWALTNADFSAGNIDGWETNYVSGQQAQNIGYQGASYSNGDVVISQFIEAWKPGATLGDGYLRQTVSGLPEGKFVLEADAIATWQNDDSRQITGAQLYITADGVTYKTDMSTKNGMPQHFSTEFMNTGEGDVIFGLRTVSANCNWLCADNFKVVFYGIDLSPYATLLASAVAEAQALDGTIPSAAYASVTDAITEYNKEYTSSKDYTTAIAAIQSATQTAQALQINYARYNAVKNAALAIATSLDTTTPDAAIAAATTNDAIETAIADLRAAFLAELPNLTIGEVGYIDVTSVMVDNASVSENVNGWTISDVERMDQYGSGPTTNFGETEFYHSNFKFYQTLALTPGTWEFGVTGFHRAGNHSTYFYAGEDKILIPGVTSDVVNTMAEAKTYFDNGNGKVALKFLIENAQDVEIGIDNKDTETDRWTIFRDFTLKYYGAPDYSVYETQWSEAVTTANEALDAQAYKYVSGSERTAVTEAIADAPDGSNKANYLEKIQALEAATATFKAAAPSYNAWVLAKTATKNLWGSALGVADPTTAAEAAAGVNALNVAQYNKVVTDYPYSLNSKIGEFNTWTQSATSGGEADTPQTLNKEHWSAATHVYYEQGVNGWAANNFTVSYSKTTNLPAGSYVIKVATRASGNVTGTISSTATENTVAIANVGAASKGITTDGVASFDEGTFAKDGVGYGWQWRFLPFTVAEAGEVTITIEAASSSQYGWVSIADGELRSVDNIATAVNYNETSKNDIVDEELANVTVSRAIKEGYNTVCLPFNLTEAQVYAAFGTGSEVYSFSDEENTDGNVKVNFNKVWAGTISANVPVLVKATAASSAQEFSGVQVVAGEAKDEGNYFDFVGVYAPTKVEADDWFIGNGALYKSAGTTNINAFRAYFKNKSGNANVEARIFIEGVETTGINEVIGKMSEVRDGSFYDLQGRKVANPSRGLYIINGHKVVIK